jgi:hypothetical protein
VGELGAYGLRVHGLDGAERWMQEQRADAPLLEVQAVEDAPDRSPSRLDAVSADLALLDGGRLRACHGETVVRFSLPLVPSAADLLHPYLAPAAALVWQWAGREALHAGAVASEAGAVLVFGHKGAGKSTVLAWLAGEAGRPVVADDLAVIDAGGVLAGPRSIDLRSPPPPSPVVIAPVRDGERVRLSLPPAPLSTPVIGSVLLEWGPRLELTPVPASQRIALLAAQRTYPPLAGDPGALLELAAQPMFALRRPQQLDQLEGTVTMLLECFS